MAGHARSLSLAAMQRLATGLLVAMTALYILVHAVGGQHWGWGYVRAFAEAAMVGGLADWFAVTALFRRPLGLPIPHTAVIPRSQGRIADALGAFIAENFLAPQLVAERVAKVDLATGVARWLADPRQADRLADGLTAAVPPLLDMLDDEAVAAFLKRLASQPAASGRIAPAVSSIIDAFVAQGRHQAMLDAALAEGWRALSENEEIIRAKVSERTNWLFRFIKVDHQVSDSLIGALQDLLREAAADPLHPFRQRVTEAVRKFAADLREDRELHRRIQAMTEDALAHPSVSQALDAAWRDAKAALRADCLANSSRVRDWARSMVASLGAELLRDDRARAALNERMRALIVELAARHGRDVSALVSETIRSWDAETVVAKLESNVGRDLQYIRLNGTVIGGLVGLALHGAPHALGLLFGS